MDKDVIALIIFGFFTVVFIWLGVVALIRLQRENEREIKRLIEEQQQIKSLKKAQQDAIVAMNKLRKEPIKWMEL